MQTRTCCSTTFSSPYSSSLTNASSITCTISRAALATTTTAATAAIIAIIATIATIRLGGQPGARVSTIIMIAAFTTAALDTPTMIIQTANITTVTAVGVEIGDITIVIIGSAAGAGAARATDPPSASKSP